MAFHEAQYDVYFILGDPATPPLWSWPIWQQFLPTINPLLHVARGKVAVRCVQLLPNQKGVVKFGRLGWNESDHQKWSHGSPFNADESTSWMFSHLHVWAPTWNVCERENKAPDIFLAIHNESLGGGYKQDLLFNPVVIIGVISLLASREHTLVRSAISALHKLSSSKLIGYRQRPWGYASGSGFTNAIDYLGVTGLFKHGPHHKGQIGLHLFSEKWEPVVF